MKKNRNEKELRRLSLVVELMKKDLAKIAGFFVGMLTVILASAEIIKNISQGYSFTTPIIVIAITLLSLIFFYKCYRKQKTIT